MRNDNVGELSGEIAGQRFTMKNAPVNTIATFLTLLGTALIAYALWMHQQDAREGTANFIAALREQTSAIRDQTSAAREQNCLLRTPDRPDRAEYCKQITR